MTEDSKNFKNKVDQLLKRHDFIDESDWKNICFALFLDYQDKVNEQKKT